MIKFFFCLLLLFSSNSLLAQSQVLSPSIQNNSTLVIGIFPRRDPALTIRLFKPLKNYLEQHTRYKFILETSPNFEVFNKKLQQRRYDIVHFNQYHYVKSHDHLKYDVLVQNEELGEKTIRGGIFVRKDSGINSLQQLRGKRVLFGGGKKAMMSYIVPLYLLRQSGLHETDFKALFASNPPNAILATYTRQVAASGAGEVATRLPVVTSKINSKELKALALSEEMANLPWAIKRELSGDIAEQIKQLLITLKSSETGRKILKAAKLTAFNPVTDEDYNQHREIINFVESNHYGTD
jgi:phosphonate transport system substrate-binding protein